MHTHTVKQDEAGTYALHRDGRILNCPKTVFPQPTQNQVTGAYGMNLMRFPCTTDCPFAQLKVETQVENSNEQVKRVTYEISCEGGIKNIVLDGVINFEKPPATSPLQIATK